MKKYATYEKLKAHFEQVRELRMRDLFEAEPGRASRFSLQFNDILLDYSKNRITPETCDLLIELARESGIEDWRDRMFAGDKINMTEGRAVLHVALRNRSDRPIQVGGQDVMPAVIEVLQQMFRFASGVRSGTWQGYTGRQITDIVNIGIGGSDLGPRMVCEALSPYAEANLNAHFLSNVDGTHTDAVLGRLDPETTLFIISSKTFTTQETMTNAHAAREWFLAAAGHPNHIARHFVAVSTNHDAVVDFGIDPENMFAFWGWVGGRYSLWSAIGLSILLMIGEENFKALLNGAHEMDRHFVEAPLEKNMPVIMAMLGIWYNNFFDAQSYAILPYDHNLRNLPLYLQQTDMESNGKSVDRGGARVTYSTGPVIWGSMGINGQHAFYQLIHQGTKMVPADFIACIQSHSKRKKQHDIMISNFLAQTEALMRGRTRPETEEGLQSTGLNEADYVNRVDHMVFEGNHPSNSLLLDKLTPSALGSLLALYEHKIFVQGIVWNLNSYDQWGVELGKQLASTLLSEINGDTDTAEHDSSTASLRDRYRKMCNKAGGQCE